MNWLRRMAMAVGQRLLRRGRPDQPSAPRAPVSPFMPRLWGLGLLLLASASGLVWRAVQLQLTQHDYLSHQGELRSSRIAVLPAHRGQITDRNGAPLAVNRLLDPPWNGIARLTDGQGTDDPLLEAFAAGRLLSLTPAGSTSAASPRRAPAPGLSGLRVSRYYPAGEVTGHLLGFTNAAEVGQEGLERAFNAQLGGENGLIRVRKDARGHVVQEIEQLRQPRAGHDLRLALDLRIQSLAFQALLETRTSHHAEAGSAVVLDVTTGEVLALVSQPSYNPNVRADFTNAVYRNHAATDLHEPGSTIKPFLVATGLADGRYGPASVIDTSPGYLLVGDIREQDEHNLGAIDLAGVLAHSSNVGMARLALSLPPRDIWETLSRLGFGRVSGSGFPGEPAGVLTFWRQWRRAGIATLSHGYGLSATPLQLAHAYATLGALGLARPLSLLPVTTPPPGERVLPARVCRELLRMLESVVVAEGATGRQAAIPGYRVAGKTGTAQKLHAGRYDGQAYTALFAGVAPATRPRLAVVVVVDNLPGNGPHQGGEVAAPVFSRIMGQSLTLLRVPPDGSPESAPAAGLRVATAPRPAASRLIAGR